MHEFNQICTSELTKESKILILLILKTAGKIHQLLNVMKSPVICTTLQLFHSPGLLVITNISSGMAGTMIKNDIFHTVRIS